MFPFEADALFPQELRGAAQYLPRILRAVEFAHGLRHDLYRVGSIAEEFVLICGFGVHWKSVVLVLSSVCCGGAFSGIVSDVAKQKGDENPFHCRLLKKLYFFLKAVPTPKILFSASR